MDCNNQEEYGHYFRYVGDLEYIDIYRIQDLWGVHGPAGHALKKIMCLGLRGAKDIDTDIDEAIKSLTRLKQMRRENQPKLVSKD